MEFVYVVLGILIVTRVRQALRSSCIIRAARFHLSQCQPFPSLLVAYTPGRPLSQVFNRLVRIYTVPAIPVFQMQVNTRETPVHPIIGPSQHQPQHHPSQLAFIRPAQMSLFARVTCYPPLGQLTCPRRIQKSLGSEKDDMVSSLPMR